MASTRIEQGSLVVGMRGPYAPLVLHFDPIPGLDFAAATTLDLTLEVVGPGISFTIPPTSFGVSAIGPCMIRVGLP